MGTPFITIMSMIIEISKILLQYCLAFCVIQDWGAGVGLEAKSD